MKSFLRIFFFSCSVLWAAPARAGSCLTLDPEKDNLNPDEQKAALVLMESALESAGKEISEDNCAGTYSLTHVRLGSSITVLLEGPEGTRTLSAENLEDLPAVYDRLAKALIWDQSTEEVVDRTNVTQEEQERVQLEAEGLHYLSTGMGGVWAASPSGGPVLGLGHRHELDRIAIDALFRIIIPTLSESAESYALNMTFLRIAGLGFLKPTANNTPYLGVGLGMGMTVDQSGSAVGAQGEVIAGMEFLRASTIRFFVQGDFIAPFYTTEYWIPSSAITAGIGFHPTPKVTQEDTIWFFPN